MPIDRAADWPIRTLTCSDCGEQFHETINGNDGKVSAGLHALSHSQKTNHHNFEWKVPV